jgi:hemolysin III
MAEAPKGDKPRLRGISHALACGVALIAGAILVTSVHGMHARLAVGIYALTLVMMYGISASYHVPDWTPRIREWWRKADHAAIFVLIAGTATPFCVLVLPAEAGHRLLLTMWIGAAVGVGQSLFWIRAPKLLTAMLCLALGWLGAPFLPVFFQSLGARGVTLIMAGGIVYTAGAIIYSLKKPNPVPGIFGYHEVFHLLVIAGSAFHFLAVSEAVTGLSIP